MRYVKQIGIIMGITLAGEVLNHVVPLPVPACLSCWQPLCAGP